MPFCEENQDKLSLYVAGELESDAELKLKEHLADCEACEGQVQFLKGFQNRLVDAEAHTCPDDVRSRLTDLLAKEMAEPASSDKVVDLGSRRAQKSSRFGRWTKILSTAAAICVVSLGLIHSQYAPESPVAVASLVEHHDTCWHIGPSEGRNAQFQQWVDKLGTMPPAPTTSPELVAFDRRECPAGEVRAGHLLYQAGEQKVSVYILPARGFLNSYGDNPLKDHEHDGRNVVLKKKGDWVYGVVAELPAAEIERLVDTEHLAMLQTYLASLENEQRV